ncbi:cysteine desulfurase [Bdellovibrio sp. SKB1291214]|uniref:cysteine desulfurase family protein n=1 Tax=Bdellovibrio sp. SKB1291214 TaxID=1732569 RepID=UPI000B517AB4|nr:cysteine desulfurase family protein [Bdellovibrio sp. SKB1291214]UYL09642.1 cysteine desulfurase [Bdellovibrio sp. SKB1291214]
MEITSEKLSTAAQTASDKGLYLDYNATTPVDPQVFTAMEPYFKEFFGNPASVGHHWGWAAENGVQKARMQVASFIGAKSSEITFTSSATESNNWVIFGLLSKLREENPNQPIHFITSCVEHSSVIKAMLAAEKQGVEVDFLPVNKYGQVEIETLRQAIKPHTKLISLIWVNNEIGSINPILEIAQLAKEKQIYLHTDATQAIGKLKVDVTGMGIDLMSFSAHKMYGPKGSAALYIRGKDPKVVLNPLIYGGGQEKGLRSGTLNVPAIVGLGVASELCKNGLDSEIARMTSLRNLLWSKLQAAIPGLRLNGHPMERSPINLNITLPGIKVESLTAKIQKLGISTGSACSSGSMTISHVLKGIGLSPEEAQCTFRISLGRWTTEEDIQRAVDILSGAIPT